MQLANYSVAYEETQSNRVSDFHDFVCSLIPKAILFDFYFSLLALWLTIKKSSQLALRLTTMKSSLLAL